MQEVVVFLMCGPIVRSLVHGKDSTCESLSAPPCVY